MIDLRPRMILVDVGAKARQFEDMAWQAGMSWFRRPKMVARIYQPAKTAMQSGTAKTNDWVLDFEPVSPRETDPLMGWTSSADMVQQIALRFSTKNEAIAYATRNGIPYRVHDPHGRKPSKKAYADNFKFGRVGTWTH